MNRHWWRLAPGGVVFGVVCTVLSLTPSLLPRPAFFQGAIGGVSFALGYLLGVLLTALLLRVFMPAPSARATRIVWWCVGGALAVAAVPLGFAVLSWQNGVRAAVEMPPLDAVDPWRFLLGFGVTAALLLVIGKGCRGLFLMIRARISAPLAVLATVAAVLAAAVGVGALGMAAVDRIYAERNTAPPEDAQEPDSAFRSAGEGSGISWQDLGRHGSLFVGGGPAAAEIEKATGAPALEPIRVYAGLASAPDAASRAELVVAELERTGAFEREWLVVATTTGSGWLEPQTVDAFEYLHGGDTAIASMQYAYTPSWVSFVFDPDAPVESATALFDAVHARWSELPESERPKLVAYGLSLGAHGTQAAFSGVDDLRARTDGALLVGSPNGSEMWRGLQAARDAGSPAWRPVLDGGRAVRWMSREGDERLIDAPWQDPRVLYLQHATDPVTWLGPELIWAPPEWLDAEQRAEDVSPAMRWMPGITAVQLVVDMFMGESVPARHGHNYGDLVLTAWTSVTDDGGLDGAALARVQAILESYADPIDPAFE
ncbi:alpha/beta hydrolase [Leucobacter triazinivorans]|uniref:alpha/beta hydrolase n=1 Tax=Leucobacter triazinivorans TaxID=1784719 RepID=UPI0013EEB93A|nr:alpha/beta-hydrolase family protein [Leucobacter triazinivorans]